MDATQYYITTLTNAAMKLGPMIFYLVAGYFLFIKLPFLLYYRTLQKPKSSEFETKFDFDQDFQKRMEEERRREFEERMKNLGSKKQESEKKKAEAHFESKQEKTEHKREEKRKETKQERKKEAPKASEQIKATPEEILFKLKPGQAFTAQELKKRYHQLLHENHPDKFRTDHQKEFAEAKTKSINEAYQKLKKRVS